MFAGLWLPGTWWQQGLPSGTLNGRGCEYSFCLQKLRVVVQPSNSAVNPERSNDYSSHEPRMRENDWMLRFYARGCRGSRRSETAVRRHGLRRIDKKDTERRFLILTVCFLA